MIETEKQTETNPNLWQEIESLPPANHFVPSPKFTSVNPLSRTRVHAVYVLWRPINICV